MAARRSFARLVASLVASVALPAAVHAADPAGTWAGILERDGARVEIELEFTRRGEGIEGTFSSPQLRAVRIPLSKVESRGRLMQWQLAGDATTISAEGEAGDESFAGRFREGAAAGSFALRRMAASRFSAREEELSFMGGGGIALSGTIVWPKGDGPFPGIVFIQGSGAEGRWASRYLAHEFARAGIAGLIYDKRGVGASMGDWRSAGFAELVEDASAAVDALRRRSAISAARVGIHGHSQGGTIAPWVAAVNPHVGFVVASAASGVSMARAEIFSLENALGVPRLADADKRLAQRFVRALVAAAYDGESREALEEARRQAEGKPWIIAVPPESSSYWAFSRRIAGYDPRERWRAVRVPTLLVYGSRDERVPVEESTARIRTAMPAAPDVIVFADADHAFRMTPAMSAPFAWPRSAPGYPERVVDWVVGVTRR